MMALRFKHVVLLGIAGALFCSCGGKSVTSNPGGDGDGDEPEPIRPDYCEEYPGNRFYCDGSERFSVGQAIELARDQGFIPEGAVLVGLQSDAAGGLAPDGLLHANGEWRLAYLSLNGELHDLRVRLDKVSEGISAKTDCSTDDEITPAALERDVQLATTLLEEEYGMVYEPGTFSLNVWRNSACAFWTGRRNTIVTSQTVNASDMRFTVDFDEAHPEGVVCQPNSSQGCPDD